VQQDGSIKRIQKRVNLGTTAEFPTFRLARQAAEPYLCRLNSASYRPRHAGTLADFIKLYERDVLPQLQPSTQSAMRSILAKQILPALGRLRLYEVQPETVQAWVAELSRTALSPKTIRNCFVALRSVWRSLRSWGRVQHDTFTGVVLPRMQPVEVRCFTLEEVQKILAASAEPYRTFFWIAAETGLRAGELCALRWEDVDFDSSFLHVRQALSLGVVSKTKTQAGRRVVALSVGLTQALIRLGPGQGLIFHARTGSPRISGMVVKRTLQPLLARLGIPPAGMNAFRHFHATMLDRLNVPGAVRKARMGHSSLTVTERYTHLASEDERRAVEGISDRITANSVTKFCDQNPAVVM
jgi:integrase